MNFTLVVRFLIYTSRVTRSMIVFGGTEVVYICDHENFE